MKRSLYVVSGAGFLLISSPWSALPLRQRRPCRSRRRKAPVPTCAPPPKPHDAAYLIGSSDVLAITVWKEPEISKSIPVRPDGKISLPLVGELQAAGRTPLQLEQEIAGKLKTYITNPDVNVIVQQINSEKFNVLGRVAQPGSFPLTGRPPCWMPRDRRRFYGFREAEGRLYSSHGSRAEARRGLPSTTKT